MTPSVWKQLLFFGPTVLFIVLVLGGCSLKGKYSHEYLSCTMDDGRYQVEIDLQRATGAPSDREHAIFERACIAARGIARPTNYTGPVAP